MPADARRVQEFMTKDVGFKISGSRLVVQDLWFKIYGSRSMVQDLRFKICGLGLMLEWWAEGQELGFRVSGFRDLGFRV